MMGSAATKTSKDKTASQAEGHSQTPSQQPVISGNQAGITGLQELAGNRAVDQALDSENDNTRQTGAIRDSMDHAANSELKTLPSANATVADAKGLPPAVRSVLTGGGGSPLEPGIRRFMESRFGYDFSPVRIHTSASASDSARQVNAAAYTVGKDVVFGEGRYAPGSLAGKELVAHELAHTVQQNLHGFESPALSPRSASECSADIAASSAVQGRPVGQVGSTTIGIARQILEPLQEGRGHDDESLLIEDSSRMFELHNLSDKLLLREFMRVSRALQAPESYGGREQDVQYEVALWEEILSRPGNLASSKSLPRPHSLKTSVDPRRISEASIKKEVKRIRYWQATNLVSDEEKVHLELQLVTFKNELKRRSEKRERRDKEKQVWERRLRGFSDVRLAKNLKRYREKGITEPVNRGVKLKFELLMAEQERRISQKRNYALLSELGLQNAVHSAEKKKHSKNWREGIRESEWLSAEKMRRRSHRLGGVRIPKDFIAIKKRSATVDEEILSRKKTEKFPRGPGHDFFFVNNRDRGVFFLVDPPKWAPEEIKEEIGLLNWWYEMEREGKNRKEIIEMMNGYFLGQAEANLRIQDAENQEYYKTRPQRGAALAFFDLSEPHFENPLSPGYGVLDLFKSKLRIIDIHSAKKSPEMIIRDMYGQYRRMQGGVKASRMGTMGAFSSALGSLTPKVSRLSPSKKYLGGKVKNFRLAKAIQQEVKKNSPISRGAGLPAKVRPGVRESLPAPRIRKLGTATGSSDGVELRAPVKKVPVDTRRSGHIRKPPPGATSKPTSRELKLGTATGSSDGVELRAPVKKVPVDTRRSGHIRQQSSTGKPVTPIKKPAIKTSKPSRPIVSNLSDVDVSDLTPSKLAEYKARYPAYYREERMKYEEGSRRSRPFSNEEDYIRFRHGVATNQINKARRGNTPRNIGERGVIEQLAGHELEYVVNKGHLPKGSANPHTNSFPTSEKNVAPDHLPPGKRIVFLNEKGQKAKSGKRFSAQFVGDSKYLGDKIPNNEQTRGFILLARHSDELTMVFYVRWRDAFPKSSKLVYSSKYGGYTLPVRSWHKKLVAPGLRKLATDKKIKIRIVSDPNWK